MAQASIVTGVYFSFAYSVLAAWRMGMIGVSLFPEGEEILIRLAGGLLVAHHRLGASQL